MIATLVLLWLSVYALMAGTTYLPDYALIVGLGPN